MMDKFSVGSTLTFEEIIVSDPQAAAEAFKILATGLIVMAEDRLERGVPLEPRKSNPTIHQWTSSENSMVLLAKSLILMKNLVDQVNGGTFLDEHGHPLERNDAFVQIKNFVSTQENP